MKQHTQALRQQVEGGIEGLRKRDHGEPSEGAVPHHLAHLTCEQ